MHLNPFAHLMNGNKKYLFGGMILSSFWQRLKDTFIVFHGDIMNEQLGLLDYLFPLAWLSVRLTLLIGTGRGALMYCILALSFIPLVIFELVKFSVAFVLTIAVTPIIAIVHGLIKSKANNLNQRIASLEVRKINMVGNRNIEDIFPADRTQWKLEQSKKIGEENILSRVRIYPLYGPLPEMKGSFSDHREGDSYPSLNAFVLCCRLFKGEDDAAEFSGNRPFAVIEITPGNADAIEAMLQTNYFFGVADLHADDVVAAIEASKLPQKRKEAFLMGDHDRLGCTEDGQNTPLYNFLHDPIFAHGKGNLAKLIFDQLETPKVPAAPVQVTEDEVDDEKYMGEDVPLISREASGR